ncbi:hypothetical protein HELRODRAFT_174778 [Helobdella robusta]|uniref:Uncharacterized protein n=1 Tax=Helobdella robusta TaxID=6412 RepID=T1F8G6_HELRO|nr:hypothetical protein HELRODRAFT_174778 [Helobdella robusta]ESO01232.1 hypothetical protein HELRODRAFT_174778 [Helobdella robusta]
MSKYWGELPDTDDEEVVEDFDFTTIKLDKPNTSNNVQYFPVYQPVIHAESFLPPDIYFSEDPRITANIDLVSYIVKHEDHLNGLESKVKDLKENHIPNNIETVLSMLSLPIVPPPVLSEQTSCHNFNSDHDNIAKLQSYTDSDFYNGRFPNGLKSLNAMLLAADHKDELVLKSISTIGLLAGYTGIEELCLNVLCTVFGQFMRLLTTQLKALWDINSSEKPFPDLIGKVLYEMNQGKCIDVVRSCRTQFINNSSYLLKTSNTVYNDCLKQQEHFRKIIPELITKLSADNNQQLHHHHDNPDQNISMETLTEENCVNYSDQAMNSFLNPNLESHNETIPPYKKLNSAVFISIYIL